ncbi:MAG: hypothetical protein VKP62_00165 [Candidatus Sericytochromatia bacterium]|nr:hypothetical protein [Candidatus Sericytochromatia bacterium]
MRRAGSLAVHWNELARRSVVVAASWACGACHPVGPGSPEPRSFPLDATQGLQRLRLQGQVLHQGQAVRGAQLQAFDLATERVVPVMAMETTTWFTDDQGRFSLELLTRSPHQVFKLMAVGEGRAYVTLCDGRGQSLSSDVATRNARFQLAQWPLAAPVRLTPASTLLAQVLEGPLQLQFRLPDTQRDVAVAQSLDATRLLVDQLEVGLGANPMLAERLVRNVDTQGRARTRETLVAPLVSLDLLTAVNDLTNLVVRTFNRQTDPFVPQVSREAGLAPLSPEAFPLGTFNLSEDGNFSYVDANGQAIDGVLTLEALSEEPLPSSAPPSGPTGALASPEPAPGFIPGSESFASATLAIQDGSLRNPTASEGVTP